MKSSCIFLMIFFISFYASEAWFSKTATTKIQQPVVKVPKEPVLIVNDYVTGTKITLVGVSHGSPTSARLVQETIKKNGPAAVVLELCDDRFISLSLDAELRPKENLTLINRYDEVLSKLKQKKAERTITAGLDPIAKLFGLFQFAKGQGIVGGVFVTIGILVNNLQRLSNSKTEDEFTTAIREAYDLRIPIRMGDADQNATLDSLKGILSTDTFNPSKVSQGARLLAFSTFGLLPTDSYKSLAAKIDPVILKESKWVNIPSAYMENKSLFSTIIPIVLISALPYGLLLPSFGSAPTEAIQALVDTGNNPLATVVSSVDSSSSAVLQSLLRGLMVTMQLFNEDSFSIAADTVSALLLIRMAKIIGTDRDAIIATKIQKVAREFKGKEIVVVIGMLHCNGVARWLLSGQDPETTYSKDK